MKKYALGIDLGGTGTKFGLVNDEGQVLRSNSIPTQQYPDIDEYCDVLCAGLKRLVEDEGLTMGDIVGVGCGAPNANFYSGNYNRYKGEDAIRWRQKNEQKEQSRKYQAALTREMKGITDGFVATHPDWTPDDIKLTVKVID